MTTFVDANVIIDVLDDTSPHFSWSLNALEKAKRRGSVFISDAVYSEISVSLPNVQAVDQVLKVLSLTRCTYPDEALFRAGKAYAAYRKNKGTKTNVLADFFIGALAAVEEAPLVTRDPRKIKTYFPHVKLISPKSTKTA